MASLFLSRIFKVKMCIKKCPQHSSVSVNAVLMPRELRLWIFMVGDVEAVAAEWLGCQLGPLFHPSQSCP